MLIFSLPPTLLLVGSQKRGDYNGRPPSIDLHDGSHGDSVLDKRPYSSEGGDESAHPCGSPTKSELYTVVKVTSV